jgi:hypothetical protein
VGIPTGTNVTIALQQRNGVFCEIRAEMLYAGQVRSYVSVVVSCCCKKLVAEAGESSGNR